MAAPQTQVLHQFPQHLQHQHLHQQPQHILPHPTASAPTTAAAAMANASSSSTSPPNTNPPFSNNSPSTNHITHNGTSNTGPPLSSASSADATRTADKPLKWEGDQILHIYMIDYCRKRGYAQTVQALSLESGARHELKPNIDAPQGLLFEWWVVFWDLFLAKNNAPAGSPNALLYVQSQKRRAEQGQQAQQAMRPHAWQSTPSHIPAPPHLANVLPQQPLGPQKQLSMNGATNGSPAAQAPSAQSPFNAQPQRSQPMSVNPNMNAQQQPPQQSMPPGVTGQLHHPQMQHRMLPGQQPPHPMHDRAPSANQNFSSPVMAHTATSTGQNPAPAPSPQFAHLNQGSNQQYHASQPPQMQGQQQNNQPFLQSSRSSTPGQASGQQQASTPGPNQSHLGQQPGSSSSSPARSGPPGVNTTPRMSQLANPAQQNGQPLPGGNAPGLQRPGVMPQRPIQPNASPRLGGQGQGQGPGPGSGPGQQPAMQQLGAQQQTQHHGQPGGPGQSPYASHVLTAPGGYPGLIPPGTKAEDLVTMPLYPQAASMCNLEGKSPNALTQEDKMRIIHTMGRMVRTNGNNLGPSQRPQMQGHVHGHPGVGQYGHPPYQVQAHQAAVAAAAMKRPGSPTAFNEASPRDSSPPDRKRARRNSQGGADQRPPGNPPQGFAPGVPMQQTNGMMRPSGPPLMNGQPTTMNQLRPQNARVPYPIPGGPSTSNQPVPQQQQQPMQHGAKLNGATQSPVPSAVSGPPMTVPADDKKLVQPHATPTGGPPKTLAGQMKGSGMMLPPSPSLASQKPNTGLPPMTKDPKKEASTPTSVEATSRSPRSAATPKANASTPGQSATPVPAPATPVPGPPPFSTAPSPSSILMNQAQHQQPQTNGPPTAVPSALSSTSFSYPFNTTPSFGLPLDDYDPNLLGAKDELGGLGGEFSVGSDEFDKYLKEFLNPPEGGEDNDGLATV